MWRFVLASLGGTSLGELKNASARHVDLVHGGLDAGSFKVDLSHSRAPDLSTGDVLVKAYYETEAGEKQLKVCGPLITCEEVGDDAGNGSLAVTFGSVFWRLAFRLLGKSVSGYSVGTSLAPVERCQMSADFISRVQEPSTANPDAGGDAGIRIGTITPSSKTYVGPYFYKPVAEAINELSNVLDGFEFDVIPTEPTPDGFGVALGTYTAAPFIGQSRPDVVFEYGTGKRNVSDYKVQLSNEGLLNDGFNLPAGFPDNATESVVRATDLLSVLTRTRYEGVVPGDLVVPELRQALVNEHVAIRARPREVFTFTPTTRSGYEFGVDYGVGDIVTARVKKRIGDLDESVRFNGLVRVYGASFDIDDNGQAAAGLTLIPTDGS